MKWIPFSMRCLPAVLLALFGMLSAGCGGSDTPDGAGKAANTKASAARKAAELAPGMTGAPSLSGVGAPVSVRFDFKSRPQAGEPLTIDLAFLPQTVSTRLSASFVSGGPGVVIQPSSMPAEYRDVQPDTAYRHELTVVPERNGVFSINAVVQMDSPTGPSMKTFAIPILVGPPPPAPAAAAASN